MAGPGCGCRHPLKGVQRPRGAGTCDSRSALASWLQEPGRGETYCHRHCYSQDPVGTERRGAVRSAGRAHGAPPTPCPCRPLLAAPAALASAAPAAGEEQAGQAAQPRTSVRVLPSASQSPRAGHGVPSGPISTGRRGSRPRPQPRAALGQWPSERPAPTPPRCAPPASQRSRTAVRGTDSARPQCPHERTQERRAEGPGPGRQARGCCGGLRGGEGAPAWEVASE